MRSQSETRSPAIPAILDDWKAGRHDAALQAAGHLSSGGDIAAVGLILTLAGMPEAPENAWVQAREALEAAPSTPARNRHLAYLTAAGLGAAADIRKALDLRRQDAQGGDVQALVELALLAHWAGLSDFALTALNAGAAQDAAHAIAALLRIGLEDGKIAPAARSRAPGLGKSGHPLGPYLELRTRDLPVSRPTNAAPELSAELLDRIEKWIMASPQAADRLNDTPRIATAPAFMPPALCDYLVANSAGHMRPAGIIDPNTGEARPDPHRRAMVATLPDGTIDLVVWAIKDRMARLAGHSFDKGEPLSILGYRPGDEYRPHYDFLTGKDGRVAQDLARRGQRVATCLVRLSDDFEGGETIFPRLDLTWTGQAGGALTFSNVDASGAGDEKTLHAGSPVRSGLKLMASLWLRETA